MVCGKVTSVNLSLVVPCFNESRRLPAMLKDLVASMKELTPRLPSFEILVVEDGSRPDEVARVAALLKQPHLQGDSWRFIHVVLEKNAGKGAALEHGFRLATGEWVAFIDADGSTCAASFIEIVDKLKSEPNVDVWIGSRILMLGRRVERNVTRHLVGRVFATLVWLMFRVPAYDTQCGCKFFRASKISSLLPLIQDRRWVWDTQLLILCYLRGLSMREHPVEWSEVSGSRVSLLRDPWRMFVSLWKFRGVVAQGAERIV